MPENKLVVVYETMSSKKEICRDINASYVPRLKETVCFNKANENIPEFARKEPFNVQEVEFNLPHLIIVRVWNNYYD